MALTTLSVRDIRNIEACDLSLSSGFNFFVGPNGSGKTSILEAVYLLGHGRSFRSGITARVVRYQQACLVVHGKIKMQHGLLPLGLQKNQDGSNLIRIGGERSQKLVQLAQVLPIQLIHPDGFELMTGGPKFRRAFMDWGVFHVEPLFFSAWSRVRRLIKQRNALLKSARSYQELGYWDNELVGLTAQITHWRKAYLKRFIPKATALCQRFLPDYQVDFSYKSGWDKKNDYAQVLSNNFERDKLLGFTASGLHKSDLGLKVDGVPVEDVLSRGQLKLLMCALRLAQGQQLNTDTNKECLYLIDDFASELDSQCRRLLIDKLIAMNAQVFISAIEPDQVAEMLTENSKMFHVEQGKITEG